MERKVLSRDSALKEYQFMTSKYFPPRKLEADQICQFFGALFVFHTYAMKNNRPGERTDFFCKRSPTVSTLEGVWFLQLVLDNVQAGAKETYRLIVRRPICQFFGALFGVYTYAMSITGLVSTLTSVAEEPYCIYSGRCMIHAAGSR